MNLALCLEFKVDYDCDIQDIIGLGKNYMFFRDSNGANIAKILISCRAECIFQNFNASFYNAPIVNAGPLVKRRGSCTRKRNFDFKSLHLSCKQAHVTLFWFYFILFFSFCIWYQPFFTMIQMQACYMVRSKGHFLSLKILWHDNDQLQIAHTSQITDNKTIASKLINKKTILYTDI